MKKSQITWILMIVFASFLGCGQQSGNSGEAEETEENKAQSAEMESKTSKPELISKWSTDRVMKVPESVCYDPGNEVLYVANIQGNPTAKDGEGFISMLSTDGEVLDLEWVTGIDAPKGMGVHGGMLYVTNIDEIVEIDIASGEVANRYACPGAQFANDIAINDAGVVFASDMSANKIYRLENGQVEAWLESDMLKSPNGLFTTADHLMIGIDGSVLKVGYEGGSPETHVSNTGGIDGLEFVKDGYYIKSDWTGHIHLLHPEKEKQLILDTTD
ncbi:MAG: hypothetical protein KGY60_04050, partial [Bacteroidales bacterium]|nr:hypothetical protein [Bacteroidales bacterium]